MTAKQPTSKAHQITAQQIRDYLKAHPDFFKKNAELVAEMNSPERDLGNGIIDFQSYMVKSLQEDSKALKDRFEILVDFCRDNMSVQAQVHNAALRLIRARNLEQLLEALTMDLVTLFDVDVVRIAMESEDASFNETHYNEQNFSGIVLIPPGTADIALGKKKNVLLIEDSTQNQPAGFDEIFADCTNLIESCALLRLDLERVKRSVVLAFGVRHKDRFHPGQGIELLHFLAQIVAHQLDLYLEDLVEE